MISRDDHVKFARFVLLSVNEEANTLLPFVFRSMYNKTIIGLSFVISRIIKVLVRNISLWLRLITPTYFELDYSEYHRNLIQSLFMII